MQALHPAGRRAGSRTLARLGDVPISPGQTVVIADTPTAAAGDMSEKEVRVTLLALSLVLSCRCCSSCYLHHKQHADSVLLSQVAELVKMVESTDTDGDGIVSVEELCELLQKFSGEE